MAAVDCYQNQAQAEGTGQQTQSQQQQSHQQQSQSQQPHQQQATAGIPGKDDERKLFVGGLSRNTTDKELRDHFGKFGEIESITVKIDPYTGVSRGFAFMVFTNPKTIDKLLASGEHYINKRKVGYILKENLTLKFENFRLNCSFSRYTNFYVEQSMFLF